MTTSWAVRKWSCHAYCVAAMVAVTSSIPTARPGGLVSMRAVREQPPLFDRRRQPGGRRRHLGGISRATIPRFHDVAWRIEQLDVAIAADRVGRGPASSSDIDHIRSLASEADEILTRLPAQPIRSVHNDAKVGNLRFDASQAPMVLDLDTTMPGIVIFDVGELLRTATHDRIEADSDPDRVSVDPDRVDAVIEGFASGMGALLLPAERAAMRPAAPLMAIENSVRFLTDYLDGDRYYRVDYPEQNLTRAKAQAAVARSLRTVAG
jgi:Ser/Thr protein kinase RdoA (MazF antagonist)